jgi:hypothetical protein
MPIVKIRGVDEWWEGNTLTDIKNLSADISIKDGRLVLYDQVDRIPTGVGAGDYSMLNVIVWRKTTSAPSNAEYQRKFRKDKAAANLVLLRMWVPRDLINAAREAVNDLTR